MIVMDNSHLKYFCSDGNGPAAAAAAAASYEPYMNSGSDKNNNSNMPSSLTSSSAGMAMGVGAPPPSHMGMDADRMSMGGMGMGMGMGSPMMQGSSGAVGGLMMGAGGQDYELTEEDLLPEEFVPDKCDVICQRGKECFEHAGNRKFRTIIDRHLDTYMKVKSRQQKSKIVTNIVDHIQKSAGDDGGGFVRKDLLTRRWFRVSDKLAREKVGQALRDAIKSRRSAEKKKKKKKKNESTGLSSSPGSSPSPPSSRKDDAPVRGLLHHKLGATPSPTKKQQQLAQPKQTTQTPASTTGLNLAPGTSNSEIWMTQALSAGEAAASFLRRTSLDFLMPLQNSSQQQPQQLQLQQQQAMSMVPFIESRFGPTAGTSTSSGSSNLDELEPRPLNGAQQQQQQQQLDSIFSEVAGAAVVAAASGGPSPSSATYTGEDVTSSSSLEQLQQQIQDLQNQLNQQQGNPFSTTQQGGQLQQQNQQQNRQQQQLLSSAMDQQFIPAMIETSRRLSFAGGGAASGVWGNDVMGDFGLGIGSSLGRRLSLVAAAASLNNNIDNNRGTTNPLDLSNSAASLFFPTNQSNMAMLRSLQQQGYGTSNNTDSGATGDQQQQQQQNKNNNPYSGI
mmetsp:Transcript_62926/g.153207  ORF Transcript_62926/g.153207 Transcript_62926/m.153207 type:complete len:616 (+) Transcript_62926:428-2275(+)|eukprot:CAMPEP_0113472280 /NCGR_PEP_ID=MMETSP0014_2-20120614/17430_1 /TAXON_ID=2857 /ORGANISM="Nitzschia sp." /LENGTH=615 /DNA_ID=CAMNT_0000364977 /DNA_START=334 /DNA_END=2181 /DNA_ORIENTATION=+ /assembly_acc=CAM_ASM_000159